MLTPLPQKQSPCRLTMTSLPPLAFIASTSTQALTSIPQGISFIHSHLNSLLDFSTTELTIDSRIEISNMCMWFPFASKSIYTYLTFFFCLLCLLLLYSLLFDPLTLRSAFWLLCCLSLEWGLGGTCIQGRSHLAPWGGPPPKFSNFH